MCRQGGKAGLNPVGTCKGTGFDYSTFRHSILDISRSMINRDYECGQWYSLNRVLNYLQTLDHKMIDKNKLFADIMDMRPELDIDLERTYCENNFKTDQK